MGLIKLALELIDDIIEINEPQPGRHAPDTAIWKDLVRRSYGDITNKNLGVSSIDDHLTFGTFGGKKK